MKAVDIRNLIDTACFEQNADIDSNTLLSSYRFESTGEYTDPVDFRKYQNLNVIAADGKAPTIQVSLPHSCAEDAARRLANVLNEQKRRHEAH